MVEPDKYFYNLNPVTGILLSRFLFELSSKSYYQVLDGHFFILMYPVISSIL